MKLIIVGSGGHAGVVADAAMKCGHSIAGFVDDFAPLRSIRHGHPVIGSTGTFQNPFNHRVIIAIGEIAGRALVYDLLKLRGCRFVSVVHPSSTLALTCHIGEGSFIAAGAHVGPYSSVGAHCIVNTNASLDHDSILGDYSHMAPNSATGGHVQIGSHTLIGIGACVRDRLTVGSHCVIGVGSCVVKNVPDGVTEYGNPARCK